MRLPPQTPASQRPKEQIRRITRTGHIRVGTGEMTVAGNELARRHVAKLPELLLKSYSLLRSCRRP